jgi:hypothetical protein
MRPAVQTLMAQAMDKEWPRGNAAFWRNEPELFGSSFWQNEPELFGDRTRDRPPGEMSKSGDAITNPATPLQCVEIVQETGRSAEIRTRDPQSPRLVR